MTGRTHDLAAFTALNVLFVASAPLEMSVVTLVGAIGANMVGGLLPDIDDATADIWDKVRWGNTISKIIRPLMGGHRMISHSLVGMWVVGKVLELILGALSPVILVDMDIIWWATMVGYLSHLVTDTLTTEGVPWLFPLPFRFGFPPFRFARIKTGGFLEKGVVFPALLFFNGYFVYLNYPTYELFIQNYLG
jgi:inner membrane protein